MRFVLVCAHSHAVVVYLSMYSTHLFLIHEIIGFCIPLLLYTAASVPYTYSLSLVCVYVLIILDRRFFSMFVKYKVTAHRLWKTF